MKNLIAALLFLTLILGACTSSPPSAATVPASPDPTITPTHGGCSYQWAYHDLPDLSTEFQGAIQKLQTEATAKAYAFGEDCEYADGSKTFDAMETNFNITLQVTDLADKEALGNWIVQVMKIILNMPKEKIMGQRGFIILIFQSGDQNEGIYFDFYQYQSLPTRFSNAEIYQALKNPK